jgi:molybdopterin-binding protein
MKLSARNQLHGTVKDVRKGQTTAHVASISAAAWW